MPRSFALLAALLLVLSPLSLHAQEEEGGGPSGGQEEPARDTLAPLVEQLRAELARAETRVGSLTADLRDSVLALAGARQRGDALQGAVSDREADLAQLRALHDQGVRRLEAQLDTLRTQRDQTVQSLAATNADLARTRLQLTQLRIANEGQTTRLVEQRDRERAQLARAEAAERQVQQQKDATEVLNDQVRAKEAELAGVKADIVRLETEQQAKKAEYDKNVQNLRGAMRWAIIFSAVLTLLLFVVSAVLLLHRTRKGGRLAVRVREGMDAATLMLLDDTARQWQWHRTMSTILRAFVMIGIILMTALTALFVIFLQDAGAVGLDLLAEKEFWQAVAALAVPLVFLVTAHNVIEGRRLELLKLLYEMAQQPPGEPAVPVSA